MRRSDVLVLIVLSLFLPGQGAPPTPAEAKLAGQSARGKDLMAARRYADAAAVYRELVKAMPGNAGLVLNLGMALHLAGQDAAALPHLEAARRLQPESLPASLFLGAANLRLARPDAAVAPLQKAVKIQPDNREARSMLVEALVALGRYDQAEAHLRRLAQLAPSDPVIWFNLGKTYGERAGQAFEELVEAEGERESSYGLALAADLRLRQERRTAAFRFYRRALERGPALRGVHAAIARLYRAAGHPDWAAVEEEKERRLPAPDCARAPLECRFAAGKYLEVIAAPSAAKTPAAAYWRARAYGELASRAFARLTALPASAQSHEWNAEVHRSARRYAESAEAWRKAIALSPGDPRPMVELAITLRLKQDFAGARKVLEDVLALARDEPEPNYLLGDVLLAEQLPERAIPYLEKAVRAAPKEPHGRGALGRAYALVGRTADAIPHLEQALPADADGSLRLQLARAYQAAGKAEQARAALADYEEFRKAAAAERDDDAGGPGLTPPEGVAPPSR